MHVERIILKQVGAIVLIRNDELIVNGSSYGLLKQADAVTVDHGKVLINEVATPPFHVGKTQTPLGKCGQAWTRK